MLAALEQQIVERESRWTSEREFAATTVELIHSLTLVTLRVAGAKNVGKPLHIERPWEKEARKKALIGFGQFAKMIGA